jgi:hypothetical protein
MSMRKQTLILLLFCAGCVSVTAQSKCGIYATRADFLNNKLTYDFNDCNFSILGSKDIVARHAEKKLRFEFDFVFGYTDGVNRYRAYGKPSFWINHGFYQVIYEGELVIYARTIKDNRSNVHTFLFYSMEGDSPIYPLKKKFYDTTSGRAGFVKLDIAAVKKHLGLQSQEDAVYAAVNGLKPTVATPYKKRSRTFLPDFKLQPDALNF